jgi:hypothetical protein
MHLTNKLGYPDAYVNRVRKGIYKPKEERIGATSLIDAPMVRKLLLGKWDDIVLDVNDFFKMHRGIAWHEYLEAGLPEEVEGENLDVIEYSPLNISLKIDIWDEENGIIADYKTCSPWAIVFGQEKKWEEQLNVYAWAKRTQGFEVKKLIAYIFLWDWSSYDAGRDPNYPQQTFYTKELPLWDFAKQENFVNERLEYHSNPKECTAEEKWQQNKLSIDGQTVIVNGPVYAICKKDKKSAMRVLPSIDKCMEYIEQKNMVSAFKSGNIYIDKREGNCRRCNEYCNCRFVCPYSGLMKGK